MLVRTLCEPRGIVSKNPKAERNVVEESGGRFTEQATRTPGKVRWMV